MEPARKQKVYIAGPMTGLPNFNFDRFHAAEKLLFGYGYDVVNPATLDNGSTDKPWEYYMRLALRAMLECDMIYALAGSQNSRGAMIEIELARKLNMPVQHEYTGSNRDFF